MVRCDCLQIGLQLPSVRKQLETLKNGCRFCHADGIRGGEYSIRLAAKQPGLIAPQHCVICPAGNFCFILISVQLLPLHNGRACAAVQDGSKLLAGHINIRQEPSIPHTIDKPLFRCPGSSVRICRGYIRERCMLGNVRPASRFIEQLRCLAACHCLFRLLQECTAEAVLLCPRFRVLRPVRPVCGICRG